MPKSAAQLSLNEVRKVSHIKNDEITGRLLELGFRTDAEIKLSRKSFLGDTLFFCLGQKHFALRREEAESIIIKD